MISLELIQRIWHLISTMPEPSLSLKAHQLDAFAFPGEPPLLAIDGADLRHLLFPVAGNIRVPEDRRSAGIHMVSSEWVLDAGNRHFIDIVCVKPHLNDLFDIIVFEILSELLLGQQSAAQICVQVLDRWRELLNYVRGPLPSHEALIGLWGELWLLQQLVRLSPDAISVWTGPQGARFDFNIGSAAIEVKTTIQRHGLRVFIHGHDQLETPPGIRLYLAVVRIEETPSGGQTLSDSVNLLASAGVNRPALLLTLAKLGFTPDVIAGFNTIGFRVLENRYYLIDEEFPKIVSKSFTGGQMPAGIVTLNYEIDLTNVPPNPLSPQEADSLIRSLFTEPAS